MLEFRVPSFDCPRGCGLASLIGVVIVGLVMTSYEGTNEVTNLEGYLLCYLSGLIVYFWYGHYSKNGKTQFPPSSLFEGLSGEEAEELREEYSEQWEKQRGWASNEIFEAFFVTLIVTAPALIVVLGVRSWIIG
jgi:hypothetical protein